MHLLELQVRSITPSLHHHEVLQVQNRAQDLR